LSAALPMPCDLIQGHCQGHELEILAFSNLRHLQCELANDC